MHNSKIAQNKNNIFLINALNHVSTMIMFTRDLYAPVSMKTWNSSSSGGSSRKLIFKERVGEK